MTDEELPETYQPTSLRREKKPRSFVSYCIAYRTGDGLTDGAYSPVPTIEKFLEVVPTDFDLNQGMPVIVRWLEDGSDEVLYVWSIHHKAWHREKPVRK